MTSQHLTAQTSSLSPDDRHFVQRTLDLALASRQKGRHPFAAIVVDEHGHVVAKAGNNAMPPEGDPTQHAERVVAAEAGRKLSPAALAKSTLYSNAEPCAMCAGAIYWCNIGRVVYAMSEEALLQLTGSHPENPTLSLPCREVFARGQRAIEVLGPLPEFDRQAAEAHLNF